MSKELTISGLHFKSTCSEISLHVAHHKLIVVGVNVKECTSNNIDWATVIVGRNNLKMPSRIGYRDNEEIFTRMNNEDINFPDIFSASIENRNFQL